MDGEIDPDELAELIDGDTTGDDEDATGDDEDATGDDDLRIVDIRDQRAFDRGHVPDSECLPFPELTNRVAELEGASRIVTVCPHGIASRQAAQLVESYAGTDARVESLRGGIEAWERDVGDLVATPTEGPDDETDEGPEAPF